MALQSAGLVRLGELGHFLVCKAKKDEKLPNEEHQLLLGQSSFVLPRLFVSVLARMRSRLPKPISDAVAGRLVVRLC